MDRRARILVLYASQTGNAEDVAERIGREAARRAYLPQVMSMDRYDPRQLASENAVIFVASTTGQGDKPDTMKRFWKFLLNSSLSKRWLENVNYAVFGLGDSGYQKFNFVALKLDRRLADLGAKSIVYRGLGDDQHRSGYEGALDPWLTSLWSAVRGIYGREEASEPANDTAWQLDPPKYKIVYHQPHISSVAEGYSTDVQRKWIEHDRARTMIEVASGSFNPPIADDKNFGRVPNNPVFAQVIKNMRLTDTSHEQDVRHLEFDLGGSGLEYAPGDVLGVFPAQSEEAVSRFMERCGLDEPALVSVEPANAVEGYQNVAPVTLRTLVEAVMDVSSASPRRYFFEVMMHFAEAEHEKERLQYFATSEGRDDLYNYNQRERRTVTEVLEDFPSVRLPLEWLVQLVPRLRPRYFSISSSLKAHPNEIHLTMAVVQWTTPFKRKRQGLCSTWLAQLDSKTGVVPVWVTKGILKLPRPSVPLILVGPGTGCAPFRAFIEERAAIAASQPVAPILFFFGCRYSAKDFLYKEQWQAFAQDRGVLSQENGGGFFVAFSRDQPRKIYVQHRIREQSKLVYKLIEDGAAIFVSGSADKMPADVAQAFDEIAAEMGDPRAAPKKLEALGRYVVEVWT
ncbi:NADPH-dependent diflavin oxidoreductase 1 [Selaginella moellendorffii]|uniref:NADPH-dependent diflavin oxidoreductase 1 n=1 Tax=Selaginella moellendorffii TaxID=88036 RepID=UPI000D1CEE12|nr:NADPH-dependent diflavin oxidoreductase 1 [Selaginella moellendorffii]|eukprot:XP_024524113.1 NADPH-dependent diflavin oxidoreductase 1 [Selaginella moellendorffii]